MIKNAMASTMAAAALLSFGLAAQAADPPSTADVLGKLHHANKMEIDAGKMAEKNGKSAEVKNLGKTLVKDHTTADKKVTALAKQEHVDLGASTPASSGGDHDMSNMGTGAEFDSKFAQAMVDGHKQTIEEVTSARDNTSDPKLKKLLGDLQPTLQKHEDMAQKIVDQQGQK